MIRPILQNMGTATNPNLRSFYPPDPEEVVLHLELDVGRKGRRGADIFRALVATPKGLASMEPSELGVIRAQKMVVITHYDVDNLWEWFEQTVASCKADSWEACVAKLSAYFDWEFAGLRA